MHRPKLNTSQKPKNPQNPAKPWLPVVCTFPGVVAQAVSFQSGGWPLQHPTPRRASIRAHARSSGARAAGAARGAHARTNARLIPRARAPTRARAMSIVFRSGCVSELTATS